MDLWFEMRNYHKIIGAVTVCCPFMNCGKIHNKKIIVEFVTNQRGDIIKSRIS